MRPPKEMKKGRVLDPSWTLTSRIQGLDSDYRLKLQNLPVLVGAFRPVDAQCPHAMPTAPRKSRPIRSIACGASSLRADRYVPITGERRGNQMAAPHDREVQAHGVFFRTGAACIFP